MLTPARNGPLLTVDADYSDLKAHLTRALKL
jgi:hypothetical protein